jgi:hypothetical protein
MQRLKNTLKENQGKYDGRGEINEFGAASTKEYYKSEIKKLYKNMLRKTDTGKKGLRAYKTKKYYTPLTKKEYNKYLEELPKEYEE